MLTAAAEQRTLRLSIGVTVVGSRSGVSSTGTRRLTIDFTADPRWR
jgi:hypothetical protein